MHTLRVVIICSVCILQFPSLCCGPSELLLKRSAVMGESGPSAFPDGNRTEKRKLNRRKPGSRSARRAQQPCSPPTALRQPGRRDSLRPRNSNNVPGGKTCRGPATVKGHKEPGSCRNAHCWIFDVYYFSRKRLPRAVPAGSRTLRAAEPPPRRPTRVQRGGRAANRGQHQGRAGQSAFPHPPAVPAGSGSVGPGGSGGAGAISGRRRREGGG